MSGTAIVGYPNNEWSLIGTESIGLDAQDSNRLYQLRLVFFRLVRPY